MTATEDHAAGSEHHLEGGGTGPDRGLGLRAPGPPALATQDGWLDAHPAARFAVAITVGYVILAATLIASGVAFTQVFAHGRTGRWDDQVNVWFASHRSPRWNAISADFTLLADTLGMVAGAAAVTVVLLVRRWGRLAWLVVAGLAVELAVFLSTTYLVARPRPGVEHLGSTPSTYSWPSGHVAATVVLYGGMAVVVMMATPRRVPRIVAWMVAVALTVGVALSRMYRGEHHPTDTVAGLVLGIGALWVAVVALEARAARVPPAGGPGEGPAVEVPAGPAVRR